MSEVANWVAVASAEHVAIGRAQGFMRVGHAHEAPIRPLIERRLFTQGKSNGGYAVRIGLLKVGTDDMALIANAMHASARP